MTPNQCPVCYRQAQTHQDFDTNNIHVRCEVCGTYTISERAEEALDQLTAGRQRVHLLTAALRTASERGDPVLLTTQTIGPMIESVQSPATLPDGIDQLLLLIRARTDSAAATIKLDRTIAYPLLAVKDASEFAHFLREARDAGYIDLTSGDNVRLTLKGWERLKTIATEARGNLPSDPGWHKVQRQREAAEKALTAAKNEEDFQAVGLLCRELLISLAQTVYDPKRHPALDGTTPSSTDAKRMLEAFVAAELPGPSTEAARKYARSALALANDLQHSRTASFLDAALCLEATRSVVATISTISQARASS